MRRAPASVLTYTGHPIAIQPHGPETSFSARLCTVCFISGDDTRKATRADWALSDLILALNIAPDRALQFDRGARKLIVDRLGINRPVVQAWMRHSPLT